MSSKKSLFITFLIIILFSCNKDSLDDGFADANGNVSEKVLKQLRYDNADPNEDDFTVQFGYDANNRLISITDGDQTRFFNYDYRGDLKSVTGSDEPYNINELYESPYDAYEIGCVLEYDNNSNPKKVEIIDDNWDGDEIYIGEIIYDDKPNPIFYTLKAGGIIDVLNKVNLSFNVAPPELVKAYKLLPFNNMRSTIIRNMDNEIEAQIQCETTYDEDGYATNTTVTSLTEDGTEKYYITYIYR